jgi:outer membrane protein OmpA-like peptidoglycan-associated protein
MTSLQSVRIGVCGTVIVLAAGTLGCATKKYVTKTVDPIGARTTELEKKTAGHDGKLTGHDGQIEGLDRQVSAANERAKGAEGKAQDAATSAAKAQETADSAGSQAKEANSLAQKGLETTGTVERKLSARMEELDNYRLLSTGSILFGLNKSELTDEAKAQLDAEIQKLGSVKHFVIQVEGFTDKSGHTASNLNLSRRRADAVVGYLVTTAKVPLYRIHVIGLGSANPVAENSTRKGRQENRRVEVKVFSAGDTASIGAEAARNGPSSSQ